MSASRKKMLRREENMAAMTERQQEELKEAKKLKLYTAIFTIAIIAMVAVVIVTSVFSSGIIERNTTALTVDGSKVSAVELNYFYIDTVNSFLNSYGSYANLFGLDTTTALDEQYFDEENGQTWADYFLDMATTSAQRAYALYNDAQANGYTLPDEANESMESNISTMELYASLYGYSDVESYIKAMYGAGSNEKTYRQYMNLQYTAEYYYDDTLASLEYTDEDLRAAEAENYNAYSSYSYNYYYLAASNFYEGGTTDEEGTTTYSDEEKAAGLEKCKETADQLAKAATLEDLDAAIADLSINAETEGAATTAIVDRLYSSVDSKLADWITADEREVGDITCIENTTTSTAEDGTETTTVNGYYLVYFAGENDNTFSLVNARHILVGFEGGTTDDSGNTTYSDEEKAAALAEAEDLLATFKAGEATEDAFAALANENSDDTGSNTTGGLYEDIYPGQMVTNFNDWVFDASRQSGDTGIVESDYGYHVMYFSGLSDTTYRDYMITNDLKEADISEWETALVDAAELNVLNTSKVNKSLLISSGT